MRFRNTLVLLAILVALGAYVGFVELKKAPPATEGTTPEPTQAAPLLALGAGDVKAVRLVRAQQNQHTELVRKEDDSWYLAAPSQEPADQTQVQTFVEALAAIRPQRVLTETVGQLAEYNLDPPAMTVEITLRSGVTHTVAIGAQTISGSGYYGQVTGDAHIYVLPSYPTSDVERFLNTPPIHPTPEPTPTS